jgi:dTDP-glucose pyrophosphorylase
MKALVLAAGRGRRLGGITNSMSKCMLPIMLPLSGKPILEYNLARADVPEIDEIVLVVGYKAETIINRYGTRYGEKRIQYVIQSEQKGLVHAIECSREALGDDDIFLLLGDEVLVNSRHREMLKAFTKDDTFGICGVLTQKDPSKIARTYTVLADRDGRILRLVEKPKVALNNWQGTGHCVFRNKVLSYAERTPIHPERGEKELPDLIQCAVDAGRVIRLLDVCDDYVNVNCEEELAEAERLLRGKKD